MVFSVCAHAQETEKKASTQSSLLDNLAARIEIVATTTLAEFEIVWLGTGDSKALALFEAPDSGPQHGAVIVMLGPGEILEQSEFSSSIREILASSGWASIIVQREQFRLHSEEFDHAALSASLLTEAISHVNSKGYTNIVIVARGQSALHFWPILQTTAGRALGFVGIDEWFVEDFAPPIPVLNLVNRNLPKAARFAEKRFRKVKKKPSAPCELFFYAGPIDGDTGSGRILSKRIRGWIERHFNPAS